MEILPYCVCCCFRGITQSFKLCAITNKTKERKDESQKQNKRIHQKELLQNRKRQEKLQKDRRKKDLLALTLVKHGSQSDGKDEHWKRKTLSRDSVDDDRGYSGGRRAILTRSESSDNVPPAEHRGKHLPPPPPYNHHDEIAGVHGHNKHKALNSSNDEQAAKKHGIAKVDGATKMGMKREEKLERVQKVEQMTVHTVITTREKVHQNNGGEDQKSSTAKHLPAITGGAIRRNSESGHTSFGYGPHHGDHHAGGGIRKASLSGGGSDSGMSKYKLSGQRSAGGAGHLKTMLRQDSGENTSRGDARKTEMLRMRMKQEKEKQKRSATSSQDKKDKSNKSAAKLAGAKKKK